MKEKMGTPIILSVLTVGILLLGDGIWAETALPSKSSVVFELRELAKSGSSVELTQVTALDVDTRGYIYVADRFRGSIIVLDDVARLVRTIGRRGEGPGEFKNISQVQVIGRDSLLVYDSDLARITIFRSDQDRDRVVATHDLSRFSTGTPPYWIRKMSGAEDRFVAVYRRSFSPSDDPERDHDRSEVVKIIDWVGRVYRDSVLSFLARDFMVLRRASMVSVAKHPFGRRGVLAVGSEDRIYYGRNDSLRVVVVSVEGDTLANIEIAGDAEIISSRDIDAARAKLGEQWYRILRETTPRTWPAFRSFVVDDKERLWIDISPHAENGGRWTIVNAAGEPIGSATSPSYARIWAIGGGRAVGVREDDLGVPQVVVFEVFRKS